LYAPTAPRHRAPTSDLLDFAARSRIGALVSRRHPLAIGVTPYNLASARGQWMGRRILDVIEAIVRTILTIVALVVVIGLIAALFMFIFRLATDIDERIQG
jgi:hypothetical protein